MAYFENSRAINDQDPLILLIPGLHDSGPDHWQTRWERKYANARRVELGMWDDPHRNTWVNKLNLAIHRAERPVVLVAHSLGCLTVAWWAEYEQPGPDSGVIGALLAAPPDVDRPGLDPRLARFSACPRAELPFPSVVAASQNDPYCSQRSAISLARDWGSRFADAGAVGHINAASDLGDWPLGERLLDQLLRGYGPLPRERALRSFAPARPAVAGRSARRY
ncbi:MAG: serine hydrolase family protein [Sphingomonadales bacterium]|nr:serine hydrolase family protein [Sphingomonadales bacterium]